MSDVAHQTDENRKYYIIKETSHGEDVYAFVEILKIFRPPGPPAQARGGERDAMLSPGASPPAPPPPPSPSDANSGYATVAAAYANQSAGNVVTAAPTTAKVGSASSAIPGGKL